MRSAAALRPGRAARAERDETLARRDVLFARSKPFAPMTCSAASTKASAVASRRRTRNAAAEPRDAAGAGFGAARPGLAAERAFIFMTDDSMSRAASVNRPGLANSGRRASLL